jgi:hypothetical protein
MSSTTKSQQKIQLVPNRQKATKCENGVILFKEEEDVSPFHEQEGKLKKTVNLAKV